MKTIELQPILELHSVRVKPVENGWNLEKNDGFAGKNGRELACPLILLFPFLFLFCRNSCLKIGQNLNTFDFSLFLQG